MDETEKYFVLLIHPHVSIAAVGTWYVLVTMIMMNEGGFLILF